VCDVAIKKFTFAVSSSDEFLMARIQVVGFELKEVDLLL